MKYFVSFLVLQHLADEEKSGFFILIVFLMYCAFKFSLALPRGTCVGLQIVIVVFSGHTHLLFGTRSNSVKEVKVTLVLTNSPDVGDLYYM